MRQRSSVEGRSTGHRSDLTSAAVTAIAELLGVPADTVSVSTPFSDLGLPSVQLARLTAVLEDALGVPVSLTDLFDHPDIDRLVEHLATR
ncbi:acyl carrier protein [Nocardia miyunensis]|uniref:acyl carrier protein n=1 Tax=Nocardia miyunensis TaxID=282684 RepID=UPI000AC8D8E1|nr:acyl carrier protein [Nocardia miyunensis]